MLYTSPHLEIQPDPNPIHLSQHGATSACDVLFHYSDTKIEVNYEEINFPIKSQPMNNFFEVRHRKWGGGNKKTLEEISRSDGLVIGLDEVC